MSLVKARYNMKANVLTQTQVKDPVTGQIKRTWALDRTVDCQARSIASEGIRTVGSTEAFKSDDMYYDEDYVRMRVSKRISKRDRVQNVRKRTEKEGPYVDDDGEQIMFEVLGVQPVPSAFGVVVEWDILMFKVQDE